MPAGLFEFELIFLHLQVWASESAPFSSYIHSKLVRHGTRWACHRDWKG